MTSTLCVESKKNNYDRVPADFAVLLHLSGRCCHFSAGKRHFATIDWRCVYWLFVSRKKTFDPFYYRSQWK